MGKAPAVIIIARHGARLDAADTHWHTTSPAPYDTPLSYGGWVQTRALGARIAALLHARDGALTDETTKSRRRDSATATSEPISHTEPAQPQTPQRHKVVIHTSPFLRCVQTSTAISAGMAQYHGNTTRTKSNDEVAASKVSRLFTGPSRAQTMDSKAFDDRLSYKPSMSSKDHTQASTQPTADVDLMAFQKPILRVDACLGEWLSPDYYEFITAPPPSNMMVASAKAELLRSAEPLRGAKIMDPDGSVTLFPGGDAAEKTVRVDRERGASFSMDALAGVLPTNGSRKSISESAGPLQAEAGAELRDLEMKPRFNGFVSPVPTYALGHSAPIPAGYVAHARNSCVKVDFQWDSMREPQEWGDGGVYGEEWSAMHRRFRNGIASMVSWYKTKGADFDPQDAHDIDNEMKGDENDTDVVLIIVTHGAGSNALIGALTNQPVLMDVGMASLTMAVRKSETATAPIERQRSNTTGGMRRRRSSAVELGLSQDYDMKIMASTDHLRPGADSSQKTQMSSPRLMPSIPEASRTGASATSSGTASPVDSGDRPISRNSALGSMRRTTVKSASSRTFSPAPLMTSNATTNGLWGGKAPTNGHATPPSPAADLNLSLAGSSVRRLSEADRNGNSIVSATSAVSVSSHRLWSANTEDKGEPTKRRWTVGERR